MSVAKEQLKLFQALTMATSLTTANVGGGVSTVEILGATLGEVFFTMSALPEGDGDQNQISKAFYTNTNTTDDLVGAKIFLANALDDSSGNYPVSAQSDSPLDNSGKKLRIQGYDSSGDPLQSDTLALGGLTEVFDGIDFSEVHSVEVRSAITGVLTPLAGNLTLRRNAVIFGKIPAGKYSANREVNIGLADALDDTDVADDAQTDPAGVTFSRPRTYEDGLEVAGGDLVAEASQGIWFKWVQPERRKPTADQQVVVAIRGATA